MCATKKKKKRRGRKLCFKAEPGSYGPAANPCNLWVKRESSGTAPNSHSQKFPQERELGFSQGRSGTTGSFAGM